MIWSPALLKLSETISAVCPLSVHSSVPSVTDHSFAVESIDPVATTAPCGSNAKHTISCGGEEQHGVRGDDAPRRRCDCWDRGATPASRSPSTLRCFAGRGGAASGASRSTLPSRTRPALCLGTPHVQRRGSDTPHYTWAHAGSRKRPASQRGSVSPSAVLWRHLARDASLTRHSPWCVPGAYAVAALSPSPRAWLSCQTSQSQSESGGGGRAQASPARARASRQLRWWNAVAWIAFVTLAWASAAGAPSTVQSLAMTLHAAAREPLASARRSEPCSSLSGGGAHLVAKRVVESDGVHHVLVSLKREELLSSERVPDLKPGAHDVDVSAQGLRDKSVRATAAQRAVRQGPVIHGTRPLLCRIERTSPTHNRKWIPKDFRRSTTYAPPDAPPSPALTSALPKQKARPEGAAHLAGAVIAASDESIARLVERTICQRQDVRSQNLEEVEALVLMRLLDGQIRKETSVREAGREHASNAKVLG
eukprot:scaffold30391_cov109-Isochrysis_galbana.AAC.1